jgi:transcriptional regulator with XRE-family HTH domain
MSTNKKIGDRIKIAREKARNGKGISQAELADLTGIKQASLSQIESSKTTPRKPTLIAIAFILNDDFGEPWLRDFFKQSTEISNKEFDYSEIENLFAETNGLSKQSIQEMQSIWEMLRAEIKRRKSLEKNLK